MTNFTKPQLKTIRAAMQSALERLDYEGMTFNVANCTYNGGEATFKVNVLLDGTETKEQKDLTQMASLFNLNTSKVHDYHDHRSVRYRMQLVGYKTKASKMPWIVEDLLSGKEYKLTDTQAKGWFKKTEEVVS
tara:strand:+ start:116 stop:514 length:399 start_codon:yes stop_codon:yes gene_type:complete